MIAHIDLNTVVIGHRIARQYAEVVQSAKTDHERERWGIITGFVQIPLGCLISWQSSFFALVGLGYYVDHSADRAALLRFTRVFCQPGRHPLLLGFVP